MLQVTSPECGGSISISTPLSLSIEGVCSELAHARWFRLSPGRVARVSTGDRTFIRVMHCVVRTCVRAF